MTSKQKPFWKTKTLSQMSREEWESLCDCCGICCLEKLEDKVLGRLDLTSIACEFMDTTNCLCLIYEDRGFINNDCIRLTPDLIELISWLPETCAYRLVDEGKDLAWWHPLVSGDPNTVHEAGISIRDKAIPGRYVDPGDLLDYLS